MKTSVISKRIQSVEPSPTLAMASKAKAMRARGVDVVNFSAGEPDFDTFEYIKEAAIKAIVDGFTKYTPVSGMDELKEAVIEKLKADNGIAYEKSQIAVSCGAKHSIYNVIQVLCEEGDEVIIPSPYWVSYPAMTKLAGAKPKIIKGARENGFKITVDQLKETLTPAVKVLVVNSPSNPTGVMYDEKELAQIGKIAADNDIFIISDEIYEEITYGEVKHVSIASLDDKIKEKTIVVNGVSKAYSMTGWRIGYVAASKEIVAGINKIQGQSTSNPTSISQQAAVAALRGGKEEIRNMVGEFKKRRDYVCDRIESLKGTSVVKPQGAFYVFPNFSGLIGKSFSGKKIKGSLDLCDLLLEEAKVATVPGVAFGDDGCIRFSYSTSLEEIKKGMDRVADFANKLK